MILNHNRIFVLKNEINAMSSSHRIPTAEKFPPDEIRTSLCLGKICIPKTTSHFQIWNLRLDFKKNLQKTKFIKIVTFDVPAEAYYVVVLDTRVVPLIPSFLLPYPPTRVLLLVVVEVVPTRRNNLY